MKRILVGLFILASLPAFAEARKCSLKHDKILGIGESKEFDLPSKVQGKLIRMKLDEFPKLTFIARENYDKNVLIGLEIDGKEQFFVL